MASTDTADLWGAGTAAADIGLTPPSPAAAAPRSKDVAAAASSDGSASKAAKHLYEDSPFMSAGWGDPSSASVKGKGRVSATATATAASPNVPIGKSLQSTASSSPWDDVPGDLAESHTPPTESTSSSTNDNSAASSHPPKSSRERQGSIIRIPESQYLGLGDADDPSAPARIGSPPLPSAASPKSTRSVGRLRSGSQVPVPASTTLPGGPVFIPVDQAGDATDELIATDRRRRSSSSERRRTNRRSTSLASLSSSRSDDADSTVTSPSTSAIAASTTTGIGGGAGAASGSLVRAGSNKLSTVQESKQDEALLAVQTETFTAPPSPEFSPMASTLALPATASASSSASASDPRRLDMRERETSVGIEELTETLQGFQTGSLDAEAESEGNGGTGGLGDDDNAFGDDFGDGTDWQDANGLVGGGDAGVGGDDDFGDFGEFDEGLAVPETAATQEHAERSAPGFATTGPQTVAAAAPSQPQSHAWRPARFPLAASTTSLTLAEVDAEVRAALASPVHAGQAAYPFHDAVSGLLGSDTLKRLEGPRAVLASDAARRLFESLQAMPDLRAPDWTRSKTRREHLVALGVPVNLDEVLEDAPGSGRSVKPLPALQLAFTQSTLLPPASTTTGADGSSGSGAGGGAADHGGGGSATSPLSGGAPPPRASSGLVGAAGSRSSSPAPIGLASSVNAWKRREDYGVGAKPEVDLVRAQAIASYDEDHLKLQSLAYLRSLRTEMDTVTTGVATLLTYYLTLRETHASDSEVYNNMIKDLVTGAASRFGGGTGAAGLASSGGGAGGAGAGGVSRRGSARRSAAPSSGLTPRSSSGLNPSSAAHHHQQQNGRGSPAPSGAGATSPTAVVSAAPTSARR